MLNKPTLTIIIPVYNTEKYLARCLDSLVQQSCANELECIIINDGSTDSSQQIINLYQQKYPQLFKCYQKANGGLSDARNFGLQHSRGKYLAFLDSDDWLDHDLYRLALEHLETQPDIDFINLNYVEEWGSQHNFIDCQAKISRSKYFMPIIAWNKIFRSSFWQQHQFCFKKGIKHEDTELTPQIIYYAKNIAYLNNTAQLIHYERTNLASITHHKRDTQSWLQVWKSLKKFSQEKNDPNLTKFVATTLFYQLILFGGNPRISWLIYSSNRTFFNFKNILSKPRKLLRVIQMLKIDFLLLPIIYLLKIIKHSNV